jgi:hypothetical protein
MSSQLVTGVAFVVFEGGIGAAIEKRLGYIDMSYQSGIHERRPTITVFAVWIDAF